MNKGWKGRSWRYKRKKVNDLFTCFKIFSDPIIMTKSQGRGMEKKGSMDSMGECISFSGPSYGHG